VTGAQLPLASGLTGGPAGFLGTKLSGRVPEGHALGAGQVSDGRDGADVETADIVFATEVGAFKGRRNDPVIARDK